MSDDIIMAAAIDLCMIRRWAIVPLHSVRDGRCTCGRADCPSPGKHPRTAHGLHDASADPDDAWAAWERWPQSNIGIITGPASGIAVVDIDGDAGAASLASMEARYSPLPITLTAMTGRGQHRYFAAAAGIRNSAGRLGVGLDVRGEGGYVVAPPSVHISGRVYRWQDETAPLAPLPEWLHTLLVTPALPTPRPMLPAGGGDDLMRRARAYCARIEPPQPGNRDTALFSLAGNLWAMRGDDGEQLAEGQILALIATVNMLSAAPLPEKTLLEKARSAARNGTPRELKISRPAPSRAGWRSPFDIEVHP